MSFNSDGVFIASAINLALADKNPMARCYETCSIGKIFF